MVDVQKQFAEFNDAIKLKRFEENAILREKRDIIIDRLIERLPNAFEDASEEMPRFYFRDQGSYEMGTGIKPINGDFDIDQGIYFEVGIETYPDPVVLKQRVYSALEGHTQNVTIRRSCVTAFYHSDGEKIYHVDIAVYSDSTCNSDGKSRIAKGKKHSSEENRLWEVSNPEALTDLIEARFAGNDRSQFRHIVRYLKRWKDENFPSNGNASPVGIGLTVATYYHLQNKYSDITTGKHDDLEALINLVNELINHFQLIWDKDENKLVRRLRVLLPLEPETDLFMRMSNKHMEDFESNLKSFKEKLDNARNEIDPVKACEILSNVFGSDFPIPTAKETAKRHAPAIVSSSNSA